jgi:hypothetical protein
MDVERDSVMTGDLDHGHNTPVSDRPAISLRASPDSIRTLPANSTIGLIS